MYYSTFCSFLRCDIWRCWREWIVQVRILFTLQLARYIVLCQSSWCITDYPFCWHTCVFSFFLLCPCCPNLDCHGRLLQLWSELSADIRALLLREMQKWDSKHRKWYLRKMEVRVCSSKVVATACSLSACRQAIAMQQTVNTPQSALARLDKGKTSSIGKFLNEMDWLSSSQFSSRYMICRFAKAMNVHS